MIPPWRETVQHLQEKEISSFYNGGKRVMRQKIEMKILNYG